MGKEDRVGVVSFAAQPYPERPLQGTVGGTRFARFASESAADSSNLSGAIEQALTMLPGGEKGRLLILSDGLWTGDNPNNLVSRLIQRGVAVDFRMMQRSVAGDIAVVAVEGPEKVLPDEVFKLTGWIRVPVAQEVEYELLRDDQVVLAGRRALASGDRRIEFQLKAGKPGSLNYALRVKSDTVDPVPENNTARKLIGVEGAKPLLLLAARNESGAVADSKLAGIFTAAGVDTEVSAGDRVQWSIPTLSAYSGLVFENVPSQQVGAYGMELIAEWVRQSGTGLMVTGGRQSYAMGGYYKSPLDPILPVSMELRKEHRKLAIAVLAVLDCSGSMGAMVGGGKIKMDLANLGAAELFSILSPLDEVGVMVYDTAPNIVVPLKPNTTPQADRVKTLRTGPGGGGILVNAALRDALGMLSKSPCETKHIILFSDATDSEQPGDYRALMSRAKAAGITCSVIGMGLPGDCDVPMLIDLARVAGGQFYLTEDVAELPRLFAQDTFVIARSTFIEDPTEVRITGGMNTLTGRYFGNPPKIGGYNLCYIKDGALPSVLSVDEYNAPIVASWQAGLGRALCYTGQVDGKYTGPIAGWENYSSLLASLGRWTAGRTESLPNNMMLAQEIRDGSLIVKLFLDPEREEASFERLPQVSLLRQTPGLGLRSETVPMRFTEPEMLTATIPLSGSETLQATVSIDESGVTHPVRLAPVCLPYSPEFRPVESGKGRDTLLALAEATEGMERIDLSGIWNDIPRVPRLFDLSTWLLYVVIVLFLMEIFERRTGLMSAQWRRLIPHRVPTKAAREELVSPKTGEEKVGEAIGGRTLSWWEQRKKARQMRVSLKEGENTGKETIGNSLGKGGIGKTTGVFGALGGKDKEGGVGRSDSEPPEGKKGGSLASDGSSDMLDALAKARQRAKSRRGEK
ncbi:MAG TPA: hypothetical protein DEB39_08320 [Planctomycetaceae bacterium]|nr:hypothetical protein [Planctomycetaceae bacterium]